MTLQVPTILLVMQICLVSSLCAHPTPESFVEGQIREHINSISDNVQNVVHEIVSVPPDRRTFENMMTPWKKLRSTLHDRFNALTCLHPVDSSQRDEIHRIFQDVQTYISENFELHEALFSYATDAIENDHHLTSYQRYEIQEFIEYCGGQVELSGKADSDGNASVRGGVEYSRETDYGNFSGGISVEGRHDRGNGSSVEVEGKIGLEFDR